MTLIKETRALTETLLVGKGSFNRTEVSEQRTSTNGGRPPEQIPLPLSEPPLNLSALVIV